MGVDLNAIIGHNMNVNEIIRLPQLIDNWTEIAQLGEFRMRPSKWDCNYEMNEKILMLIWEDWEIEASNSEEKIFDNCIHCYFGQIDVYRNCIIVCQWNHKYSNLCYPERAKIIFEINRIIAKKLEQSIILYVPDSAFPTSCLTDEPQKGKNIYDIIAFGIEKFGKPPKPVAKAIEYMFFTDDINSELGELKEWEWSSETYWEYKNGKYVLKNGT